MWLILLAGSVAAVSSYFATSSAPKVYQTKTTVMVGRFITDPDPASTDFWTSQQLAQTYAQLAVREPVLQGTLDSLGMGEHLGWRTFARMVKSNLVAGTQLLEILVTDTNPERAVALADGVAQQLILQSPAQSDPEQQERRLFAEQQLLDLESKIEEAQAETGVLQEEMDESISARRIQTLQGQINTLQDKVNSWQNSYAQFLLYLEGGEVNYLTVVEPAQLPIRPIAPNVSMNILLAVGIAVALAVGAALLLEYLDDTVKVAEDVERTVSLPTLGAIARIEENGSSSLPVAARAPRAQVVEAYRALRTNIQFSSVERAIQMIVISSPNPVEGKSTTIANLAIVMAQSGLSTILMDADLRRPMLHRKFNLPNAGLTGALLERISEDDEQGRARRLAYLQESGIENLRILTSGSQPPNPAELLGSGRMKQLIQDLREECDVLLVDTPPALAVTDAAVMAGQADAMLLVVNAGKTRRTMLERAVEALDRTGTPILGIVLNQLTPRTGGYYYSYYRHYYSPEGAEGTGDGEGRKRPLAERIPLAKLIAPGPRDSNPS